MKKIKAIDIASESGTLPPEYQGKVYGLWGRVARVELKAISSGGFGG